MIDGTPNYLSVALQSTSPLVEKFEDGKKVPSHFPWEKLPLDLFRLIFERLDLRSIDRLRRVCSCLRTRIDDSIFHRSTLQKLFQQTYSSISPKGEPSSSCRVLPSNGNALLRVDEKVIDPLTGSVLAVVPSKYQYVSSDKGHHFYFRDTELLMVDPNGYKKTFDTSEAASAYKDLPKIQGIIYSIKLERFYKDCAEPKIAFITNSNILVCITRGGLLLKWSLDSPKCSLMRALSNPPTQKFYEIALDNDVYPYYPPKEKIPEVKVDFNSEIIAIANNSSIKIFEIKTLNVLFEEKIPNVSELRIFGDRIFACNTFLTTGYHSTRKDYLYIIEKSKEGLSHKYEVLEECYYFEKNRIVGLADRYLVVKNLNGYSIVDIVEKKVIKTIKFDGPPAHVGTPFHERRQLFLFDKALIIINTLNMEITVHSLPFLHVLSHVCLKDVDDDFNYVALENAIQVDFENIYKLYPKNTLKFTGVVFQEGEILISYEFKKPCTKTFVGKILKIGKNENDQPIRPKIELVDGDADESILPSNSEAPMPVNRNRPVLVSGERKFPLRQVVVISSIAGVSLVLAGIFSGLTFISNPTPLYHSLTGRIVLIASASNFGIVAAIGGILVVNHIRKKRRIDDFMMEEKSKVSRTTRSWF